MPYSSLLFREAINILATLISFGKYKKEYDPSKNEYEQSNKKDVVTKHELKEQEKSAKNMCEELKEYKKMLDEELITQEKYDEFKNKILK